MRSLNFKCAAETRARLKKPLADLKRKTRRIHSHLKMINRLIDDRDRLARAKERIAELERIADRSPREWGEIVAYGKRQVAAQRAVADLFKGAARFGDAGRMTKMPDLHYAEMDADGDQAGMDHGMSFTPCRGVASPQTERGGSHGPRLIGSFNLISAYQKLSLIAVPNIVPLPSVVPVECSFMPAAPSSPGFGSLAPTVREPCVVVLSAVMA